MMKRSNAAKRKNPAPGERSADLTLWIKNGCLAAFDARFAADAEVSVGRTDSERALGFTVTIGEKMVADFVLDRDQVEELAAYLQHNVYLRRPLGRRACPQFFSAMNSPKQRLYRELESAAMEAHPGYSELDEDGDIEVADGAPTGRRLVAWFKKAHPRAAARIERKFTKALWSGK
jgi:hypothetical protein